jgi:hypothetical protein
VLETLERAERSWYWYLICIPAFNISCTKVTFVVEMARRVRVSVKIANSRVKS